MDYLEETDSNYLYTSNSLIDIEKCIVTNEDNYEYGKDITLGDLEILEGIVPDSELPDRYNAFRYSNFPIMLSI